MSGQSRIAKTVVPEGENLKLDALKDGRPVMGTSNEMDVWAKPENLRMPPTCISWLCQD